MLEFTFDDKSRYTLELQFAKLRGMKEMNEKLVRKKKL